MLGLSGGLLIALPIGCGSAASPSAAAPVAASVAVAPEPAPAAEVESVKQAAGSAPAAKPVDPAPFGIRRDEPFAEVRLFSHVTLYMQEMRALQDRKLHAELRLTDAQVRTFTAHEGDVKQLVDGLPKIRPEEFETTLLKVYVPRAEQFRAIIEKELSPAQRQVVLQKVVQQQRGAIALLLPGVPERLQMTDAQRTAILKIVDENRKTLSQTTIDTGNLLELRKLMLRANAARAEAESHLTEAQQKQWVALRGK
jgi:hypothetical protein